MSKSTNLIIAAVGLGGLGFFLYKKGLFSSVSSTVVPVTPVTPVTPITPVTPTSPTSCPQGYKLQLVDINCNGANCDTHCVVTPEKVLPIVKKEPIYNPIVYNPYTDVPINIYVDPYLGAIQTPVVKPISQYNPSIIYYTDNQSDPFASAPIGKVNVVDRGLNQVIYL